MKISKILTPQVRTFLYGTIAALLSVATVQGWVSNDLAKSISDNLPTIIGAIGSIIAAANVTQKPKVTEVVAPVVPVRVADAQVTHVAQAAAVELPLTK